VVEIWFGLLAISLTIFVVLDGWNLGAGALHLVVARNAAERRQVIAAIGPMWSWHEVWLIASGGTFLLAFPGIMAAAFAGFYLALWLVLWCFVLRGVSIEIGGHVHDPLWQAAWDFVFTLSSLLLAVLFGAALGNVIRGVPIDGTHQFSMSLFTNFDVTGRVGILDWYTLSVAVLTTAIVGAHGAAYLLLSTTGAVLDRTRIWSRRLWIIAALLFLVVSFETTIVRPELYRAMMQRPLAWLAVVLALGGAWAIAVGLRRQQAMRTFVGSCGLIAGLLGGLAASVFPVLLHSTIAPEHSMTAYDGATATRGLTIALVWWPLAFALAVVYFVVMQRQYRRA
jgi:cytochrome d ubiquinol oxidase subunit II